MFGYFDLIVFLLFIASYIYTRPLIKKFRRKFRKASYKPLNLPTNGMIKRFNCMNCRLRVKFIIVKPRGVYHAMGMSYLKQQAYHKLCSDCLSDFNSFEEKTFKNNNPTGGAIIFKLIMLELFLAEKMWPSFSEVVELYSNYDLNFKNSLSLFSTKEFDGDIFALRDAVILSMDKKE